MKGKPKCTKKMWETEKNWKSPKKSHESVSFEDSLSEGKVGYCDVRLNWLRKLGTTE